MKRSPLNRVGRKTKRWIRVRREWVKLNPPDHQGGYLCALCGTWVSKEYMELDHILSRTRAPELEFELSNLQPTCSPCNEAKGSRVVDAKVSLGEYELRKKLNL
jgi:5-methylcytosine-specific restriction endonuclease McrA